MILGFFIAGLGAAATWAGYKTSTPGLIVAGGVATGLGGAVAF